jgi:pyruvate/2-oxoglutarate dehydrogenase complex dihydrolipoamide dehydrogenase (E3) component
VTAPAVTRATAGRLDAAPWDLVVVGAGTAGIVGAKTAARLGARVLLVERERPGGDCLWTGCVPSKSLVAAAEAAASARRAGRLGVDVSGVRVDFTRVMQHVRGVIAHIEPVDTPEALEAAGVRVLTGDARFTGPGTLDVDGRTIAFRQALVATGAAPAVPPVPGLADTAYLTSDSVWRLTGLPRDLVVLGGGSIGAELGQAFARLGAQVTVVEGASRLLPREDAYAARLVTASLEADGVTVRTGQAVARVEPGPDGAGVLLLEDGSRVAFGRLLVAVGRSPRTADLGLASAGVEVGPGGFLVVDDRLRTTNPRIWAAGDLTGHPQFTHVAATHGSLAASNAVLGLRRSVSGAALPRVTFTHPEVAAVGVATDPLPEGMTLAEWDHAHLDRAVAERQTEGVSRLAVDRKGRIVGATLVGPRAGESLGVVTLAITRGLTTRDLAGVVHPYPTYDDGPWNAAVAHARQALEQPAVRTATRALAGARRWWLDRR